MLILLLVLFQEPPAKEKPEWFFFARPTSGAIVTKAYGPYPTRKECNAEAHKLMPDDPRFMTNAQRKAAEKLTEQPAKAEKPAYIAMAACKAVK